MTLHLSQKGGLSRYWEHYLEDPSYYSPLLYSYKDFSIPTEFVRALGEPEDACDDEDEDDTTEGQDQPLPRPVAAN